MTTNEKATNILSPFDINGIPVRNRLVVAPMTRVTATEAGVPTQEMQDYYLRFARGGFGVVITEGLYTDQAFSQGYLFQPGLADSEQAAAWANITKAIQNEGAKMFAQIMHAGALSQGNRYKSHTIAPSAVQPKGEQMAFYYGEGVYAKPSEISPAEIEEAVCGFVDTARRAVEAGFDGIEIHGANGYLLDQFLSFATNQRSDKWGGDVERRVALLVEIIKAVKTEVNGRIPVGIRISQGKVNDFPSKWAGGEADAKVIFRALAAAGVDFLHVTEFEAWKPAFEGGQTSLVALAHRYAPGVPIIANGNLHSLERAQEVLASGATLVAIGRSALANPDMPKLFASQRELRPFDSSILGPIASIKRSELSMELAD
ncbi:NADH:flavin oxidoreductase [Cupriavidus pauculus]|uniref:NADH:flavin oxidoreductase n=1 Tax=Cupriavidus pauculus TaxID=82633 RepID=A0A2N5C3G1_9BURK|nr:NADH:flavin oxidoreductase [Cupriavidus pauculus]PLP96751.1 NADH:flavin oxidoreductase [Cupriavidus pauculus]